jgi:broad specificity phosphatase PhoE
MNRVFIMRHGGSTGNEDPSFYALNDSAICLTTNGIRQCLASAAVIAGVTPRWQKPGDFGVEAYASEYTRAKQTARVVLDQMGLLSLKPRIQPLINERDYGTKYEAKMDQDPYYHGHDSESAVNARRRVSIFIRQIDAVLYRSDVIAFSHFGTIRALIADLLQLSDTDMMQRDVRNGAVFLFERSFVAGKARFCQTELPGHILEKTASFIQMPEMVSA